MTVLAGKMAVITGATGGIGQAVAMALAGAGCRLALCGRSPEKVAASQQMLSALRGEVAGYCADMTTVAAIARLAEELETTLQQVDVLVHSAGVHALAPFEQLDAESMDLQYQINVRAPFLLTQHLLPALRKTRGQVVFINSSVSQQIARQGLAAYAASKTALKAVTDSLRSEVNADGIRVLSVYPGRTASAMQEALYKQEGRIYEPDKLLQPEDVAETVVSALSLKRTAEITDILIRPCRP